MKKDESKEQWEDEWDKKFFKFYEMGTVDHSDEMKPFIRRLLIEEKAKWLEELKKVKI